ncbi:universal stress protein [Puia sp. P3]|uniref:universal stress protein n=1 Tax=Puia sp. P3 TaxID=3423952 RepID=UPI003D67EA59
MRSIVVPVNFTENSSNAARYAADMALAIDGDIHLIHVFQLPLTTAEFPIPDITIEEMQRNGLNQLNTLMEELRQRTRNQITITSEMTSGSIEHNIEEYCKRQKPFVVVMGASGHSIENALAGSSTVKAMRHLPWPLLVIPENTPFHAIKKIVLACDLDDIGDGIPASFSFLNELTSLFSAKLDIINVATNAERSEGQAVFQFDSWKDRLKEIYPDLQLHLHQRHRRRDHPIYRRSQRGLADGIPQKTPILRISFE